MLVVLGVDVGQGIAVNTRNCQFTFILISHAQGILRITQANSTTPGRRTTQHRPVQGFHGGRGTHDILEFYKAHGAVGFGAEGEATVAEAVLEEEAEFVFGGVDGQVSDVEGVAGRVFAYQGCHAA